MITGIAKTLAVIDQLVDGLGYLGGLFVEYIQKNKALMRPLFTIEGAKQFTLTADLLLDGMKVEYRYSEDGSNLKASEINVYKYFNDYVMDLGESAGDCCHFFIFLPRGHNFQFGVLLFHGSSNYQLVRKKY